MNEQEGPGVTGIPEGLSGKPEVSQVRPRTGLPEGQIGPALERESVVSRLRRALSSIAGKNRHKPR